MVTIAVMKHQDQKLGRKGFTWPTLPHHRSLVTEGSQDRNPDWAGLGDRSHEGTQLAGLFLVACSSCCLIEPRTTTYNPRSQETVAGGSLVRAQSGTRGENEVILESGEFLIQYA